MLPEDYSNPLEAFDSVIFLTSSNWFTEPRSNRYHYATRFAKHLPVYFVQFEDGIGSISTERSGIDNLTIVHVYSKAAPLQANFDVNKLYLKQSVEFLKKLGGRRPLVWVYNPFAVAMLNALNPTLGVYHATEIYLSDDENIHAPNPRELAFLERSVKALIQSVDLVFAVSDGVYDSIASTGLAGDKLIANYNGVDAKFWLDLGATTHVPQVSGRPAVLYQGGINDRLDFPIIRAVCEAMDDWDFWFCGNESTNSKDWQLVKRLKNVTAFGSMPLEAIGEKARQASVAWAPYLKKPQLFTSMPLKMYEYSSCGLPVVSTPIRALLDADKRLFRFAEDAGQFIENIRAVEASRAEPACLDLRIAESKANSYDQRFTVTLRSIGDVQSRKAATKSLLVLYDDKFSTLPAIDWHLKSFSKYSRHQIFYVPGSIVDGMTGHNHFFPMDTGIDLDTGLNSIWDFDMFDAILIHFSLRTSIDGYIPKFLIDRLARFEGPKILFIQDEYDYVQMTWKYICAMGITDVFTCVPEAGWEYVYPKDQVPGLSLKMTLTGYIPEDSSIERCALPLSDRKLQIGYRGRQLPHHYGQLGHEKMTIGQRVKAEAEARGLAIDIETDDSKRIYTGWYQFLGSCRATLGTESGCNIFDFDDGLRKKANKLVNRSFEDIYDANFKDFEAPFEMNQISPKFFEAIVLRTALICFPGTYSGILEAGVHYIPLEKDFSNLDEVFEKLQDDDFLTVLTDRAYQDVVASGRYTYRRFIEDFDDWLDQRLPFAGGEIIMAPIAVRRGGRVTPVRHSDSRDYVLTSSPLGGSTQREAFSTLFEEIEAPSNLIAVMRLAVTPSRWLSVALSRIRPLLRLAVTPSQWLSVARRRIGRLLNTNSYKE